VDHKAHLQLRQEVISCLVLANIQLEGNNFA
jgi:hypothetical protein